MLRGFVVGLKVTLWDGSRATQLHFARYPLGCNCCSLVWMGSWFTGPVVLFFSGIFC